MAESKGMETMLAQAGREGAGGVVIKGTFPAQRFFDTLAAILSRRENVTITVTVTQKRERQQKAVI